MKNNIKMILAVFALFLAGCQDKMDLYTLGTPPDTMGLTVSEDEIVLDQDMKNEEAVVFTWDDAANRGEGTELTYYFKMDVADNNFETSIDKIEIPDGERSISFTHKEMNDLLAGWDIEPGQMTRLTGEIIAEVLKSDVYMKPELSTVDVYVTGYSIEPRDLYIVGSAVDGMEPDKALKMEEIVSEKKYFWSGVLQQGDFKFIRTSTGLSPSYSQGTNDNTLAYNETENSNETLFHVSDAGFYVITVDVEDMTIEREYPYSPYGQVWMVGNATPADWTIMNSIELDKDPLNQVVFVYEGQLYTGELKFPLELNESWYVPFLMPVEDQAGPSGDNRVEYVAPGGHDYKWYISDAGTYKIELNVYDMTISFEKQAEPTIPDDLPYKDVWITGSATPGAWNIPFFQRLTYDTDDAKGTFVWEGNLTEGEFKFPLSNTNDYACDYLMPKNVGEGDVASLLETEVEMVPGGNPDKKWKVSADEAGTYKISLNVIDMTVSFEKQ